MSNPEILPPPPIRYELQPSKPVDHEAREKLNLGPTEAQAVLDGGPSSEYAVNPVVVQVGTVAVASTVPTDHLPLAA